ncbi:hypothetical protein G4Z16_20615 [Streptomyces bathyalis]|uniref:Uncharacterized protein n=1 Tax=Streptomyces bathyalis TaxID=2710756 RepID=A0A7T1T8N2_9ACTN|nr:hypothetical protein [Streptomyces bathyalis]QPP08404.1 hypothetical protein G4Z16_20615 [Streptomyces bathyalis]
MKTVEHPLVVAYLETVKREAATLEPERRDELLADLAEHVAVALAERPAHGEADVKAVLDRLGDPRTIVATAREGETAVTPPVSAWHGTAPLILLPLAGLLVGLQPVLSGIAGIAGLVLLWAAPHWGRREKIIGTAATLLVPTGAVLVGLIHAASSAGSPRLQLSLYAAIALLPAAASVHLFRTGRRTSS